MRYAGHMQKVDKVCVGNLTAYTGSCLDVLPTLPADSVHCCVFSPPYWGLRKYSDDPAMIGLEPTFRDWLDNMVAVMREVRRVLRPDGTVWLNCGDAYAGSGKGIGSDHGKAVYSDEEIGHKVKVPNGFKPKDLLLMPARLAIALQEAGWWVRSEIIWAKPNPMPESVTDRPTSAHEKVYLLTKSARYFYDADAVREEHADTEYTRERYKYKPSDGKKSRDGINSNWKEGDLNQHWGIGGRNLRNVWTIATEPFPDAHFATYPQELVRRCIAAGTSEHGVCAKCGKQWERVVEKEKPPTRAVKSRTPEGQTKQGAFSSERFDDPIQTTTLGWRPGCSCGLEPVGATVLDPFAGSFTTCLVALKLGRRAIGIELNPAYVKMGLARCDGEARQERLL